MKVIYILEWCDFLNTNSFDMLMFGVILFVLEYDQDGFWGDIKNA